jgi:hypothetical protein
VHGAWINIIEIHDLNPDSCRGPVANGRVKLYSAQTRSQMKSVLAPTLSRLSCNLQAVNCNLHYLNGRAVAMSQVILACQAVHLPSNTGAALSVNVVHAHRDHGWPCRSSPPRSSWHSTGP